MSNPRPDQPRLAAIREMEAATRDSQPEGRIQTTRYNEDVRALLADRDRLLSDLRTLEAQWRRWAAAGDVAKAPLVNVSFKHCADDLAALLARLEGDGR